MLNYSFTVLFEGVSENDLHALLIKTHYLSQIAAAPLVALHLQFSALAPTYLCPDNSAHIQVVCHVTLETTLLHPDQLNSTWAEMDDPTLGLLNSWPILVTSFVI